MHKEHWFNIVNKHNYYKAFHVFKHRYIFHLQNI